MAYEINWEPRGVVKRFFGIVKAGEVLAAVVRVEADERFDSLRYVINDLSSVDGFEITHGEVEEVAAIDKAASLTNPGIRIAVVATLPEIVMAARAYATSKFNVFPTRIFATQFEARRWLSGST